MKCHNKNCTLDVDHYAITYEVLNGSVVKCYVKKHNRVHLGNAWLTISLNFGTKVRKLSVPREKVFDVVTVFNP